MKDNLWDSPAAVKLVNAMKPPKPPRNILLWRGNTSPRTLVYKSKTEEYLGYIEYDGYNWLFYPIHYRGGRLYISATARKECLDRIDRCYSGKYWREEFAEIQAHTFFPATQEGGVYALNEPDLTPGKPAYRRAFGRVQEIDEYLTQPQDCCLALGAFYMTYRRVFPKPLDHTKELTARYF